MSTCISPTDSSNPVPSPSPSLYYAAKYPYNPFNTASFLPSAFFPPTIPSNCVPGMWSTSKSWLYLSLISGTD